METGAGERGGKMVIFSYFAGFSESGRLEISALEMYEIFALVPRAPPKNHIYYTCKVQTGTKTGKGASAKFSEINVSKCLMPRIYIS